MGSGGASHSYTGVSGTQDVPVHALKSASVASDNCLHVIVLPQEQGDPHLMASKTQHNMLWAIT